MPLMTMSRRTTWRAARLLLALLAAACPVLAGGAFDQSRDGFVNNDTCLGCHTREAASWHDSDHAKAMQAPLPGSVLGDFNEARFEGEGLRARFHRDGTNYLVTVEENGHSETFRVAWTFGVDPLQQYLLAFPNGRLQAFPVAWDTRARRWFHLQAGDGVTAADALHWRKRFFTANSFCIDCHTTNFRLGYDSATQQYHSSASGHNVNCQACHGPGEAHLAWAQQPSPQVADKGWAQRPLTDPARVLDTCGSCHARRHPLTPATAWAAPLLDNAMPALLREGLYHPDGQIQDEVFEYGSFLQSRMHQAGVSCLDCHDPHSLKPRAAGNALCSSCHEAGNPRFPSLKAGRYDTPAHHHHAPGSAGSQCVACHMPATTYMKVDARRDHRFGIPRPDHSLTLGTPNACNACHTERSPAWAQAAIAQWYPQGRHTQPDRAGTIAAARRGDASALPGLQRLAGSAAEPAIWRATALELLGQYGATPASQLAASLQDPSALVRSAAVTAFETQPAAARQRYLPPLLRDPVRAVRTEAARLLADSSPQLATADRTAWQAALAEYRLAQTALPDHPEGHANLGQLAYHQGNAYEAIRRMKQAIDTDPHFIPAYQSLAVLYGQIGAADRAVAILQQAIPQALPEQQADLYFSLGLGHAELQQMAAARTALQQAVAKNPQHAAAHYNLGLVLQQLGDGDGALRALQQALALNGHDERTRQALAQSYLAQQRHAEALPLLEALVRDYPQDAALRQLLDDTRRRAGR